MRLTARVVQALQTGFVYNLRMPVKRPGPYHLRVALRDVGADRIGSASQLIDVPDLGKRQLTLSSLFIRGSAPAEPATVLWKSSTRRNGRGRQVSSRRAGPYVCYAYNVVRNSSGKPRVESAVRLLRDGVEVFRSGPQP